MGDTGSASSSGGSTSNLFADASLGDALTGGTGDLFGSGAGGGTPDLANLFADAGLSSALLGDSSGLGGALTTIDPSGTQAATQSITPQADVAGTPSGSDPSSNIGGTQSGGVPQANQPQPAPTPPATQQNQNESPLAQIAKALRTSFGLGQPPTAGGPTGPTPRQGPPQLEPPTIEGMPTAPGDPSSLLPPGIGRGRNFLGGIPGGIYNTMRATPAETGELPYGYGGSPNQPARPYTPTPQPAAAPGPMDPTIMAGGPGAGAAQPPPADVKPDPTATDPPAASAPPAADLPTKKDPQAPDTPEAPPGAPQGVPGPTDGMGGILRDVLGLALASAPLLPILAQMIGGRGRGRGGIPPWAFHGMMPFMRGTRRGFVGFRGGFLRPGYYPRRQGGWGFHPGGYHPGWGAWAPGVIGNQPMAFAGGDEGGGGGTPGAWAGANTQSGGVPQGTGPGSGSTRADQNLNPGNIMWGDWARAHGAIAGKGNDQGHQVAVFPNAEAGWNAMRSLALSKYNGGMRTPMQLIATPGSGWTPGSNGPAAAANIARTMGIRPNDDLNLNDPARMRRFMQALATQEGAPNLVRAFTGGGGGSQVAGGGAKPATPPAQPPVQSDDYAATG